MVPNQSEENIMTRKTTKAAEAAIIRFDNARRSFEDILKTRERTKEEHWSSYTKKCTPEHVDSFATGMLEATQGIIFQQNCYHGFVYLNANGDRLIRGELESIDQHPEFRVWRIAFCVVK
jgi:hypothetical protein